MIFALEQLLGPSGPQALETAIAAGTRQRFTGSDRPAYETLLPIDELEKLQTSEQLHSGSLRVLREGRAIPTEMLCEASDDGQAAILSHPALRRVCAQGASLLFSHIDRMVPAIAAMNAQVERRLRARTVTNCYVSHAGGSAFPPHFDPHDVLILQISGRKRWRCHGRRETAPDQPRTFRASELQAPESEFILEPGEALYLPRGDIHHAAHVGSEPTVHLTVTILPARGRELLAWLADDFAQTPAGRADIRPALDPGLLDRQEEDIRQTLHQLVDRLDLNAFLTAQDISRAPLPAERFGARPSIGPNATVQTTLRRPVPIDDPANFKAGARTAQLTPIEHAVLGLLIAHDTRNLDQLRQALPECPPEDLVDALEGLQAKCLAIVLPPGSNT